LGHASIETTHGYVEIDLEMKRKTLRSCEKLLPNNCFPELLKHQTAEESIATYVYADGENVPVAIDEYGYAGSECSLKALDFTAIWPV
jgi:hypothetical protein